MTDSKLKYRKVGWTILDRRLELGVTREALSERLGLDTAVIEKIETGNSENLLVDVIAIGIELNLDLESLFDFEQEPEAVASIPPVVLKKYR